MRLQPSLSSALAIIAWPQRIILGTLCIAQHVWLWTLLAKCVFLQLPVRGPLPFLTALDMGLVYRPLLKFLGPLLMLSLATSGHNSCSLSCQITLTVPLLTPRSFYVTMLLFV